MSPLLQSPHRGTSHLNETLPRYHNAGYDVTNLLSFPCEFLLLDTQPLQNMVRLKFMRSCFVLLHCLKGGKIICSRKTWLAGSGYKWQYSLGCSSQLPGPGHSSAMDACYNLILALLLLCSLHQDTLVAAKPAMDQVGVSNYWLIKSPVCSVTDGRRVGCYPVFE